MTAVMDRTEETTMTDELNLGDIPDLSGVGEDEQAPEWVDGWYEASLLERREFTDSNGNARVFESNDTPSASGNGRNIRLQCQIKRADGRVLNLSKIINYRADDLTQATIEAVAAQRQQMKDNGGNWGPLFRAFAALQALANLQKIAGVRQLRRTSEGGLDLAPLFGKKAYIRLTPDDRNPQFKMVKDIRADQPKRGLVK